MKVVCLSSFIFRAGATKAGDIIDVTEQEFGVIYNMVSTKIEPKIEPKERTTQVTKTTKRKGK